MENEHKARHFLLKQNNTCADGMISFCPAHEHVVMSNVQTEKHPPGIRLPLWACVFVWGNRFSDAHAHTLPFAMQLPLSSVCVFFNVQMISLRR